MKSRLFCLLLIFSFLVSFPFTVASEELKPVAQSTDRRFQDFGDGTSRHMLSTDVRREAWPLSGDPELRAVRLELHRGLRLLLHLLPQGVRRLGR